MKGCATQPVPSLYVHVPFCAKKCEYCAFFSQAVSGDRVDRYVGALILELERVAPGLSPRTVFFGGGTPSLLNLRQWERILQAMDRRGLRGAVEWTVECNPATVSLDKARLLRQAGVNRVSMGVQSLDEALLDRLGRGHSREMVFRSFDLLRRAGFDNINVDLMFAIPGQTLEVWRRTLAEAIALGSEHLSCYEVIYEEDTPLFARLKAGEFETDEELACSMYEVLLDAADAAGLVQYEIANFARHTPGGAVEAGVPGRACRHNVNYWRGGAFHGLGPSATGFVDGVRTQNRSDTDLYCRELEKGRRAVESFEQLPPLTRAGETAAFGLRMNAGWPYAAFLQTTGFDLREEWSGEMRRMEEQGWGVVEPDRFRLTREGLRFADAAACEFLRPR